PGKHLSGPPNAIDLSLSQSIRPASLDTSDLTIDGGASVTGVQVIDGHTVRFFVSVPNTAAVYHYALATGGLVDLQSQVSLPYSGSFEIDRAGPRIVAQTPSIQAADPFSEI